MNILPSTPAQSSTALSEHFLYCYCINSILSCIQTETENGVLDDVIILCSWKIPQHDSTINPFSGSLLKMFERSPMENFPCMSNCPILQNSLRGRISTTLCQVRLWADLRSCSIVAAKLQCCWLVKKVGYKRSVETSHCRNCTALCNIQLGQPSVNPPRLVLEESRINLVYPQKLN